MRKLLFVFTLGVFALLAGCGETQEPDADIEDLRVQDDEIVFDLNTEDPSDTITAYRVALFKDGEEIVALDEDDNLVTHGTNTDVRFFNLDGGDYVIEAIATYEFEGETHEDVLASDTATIEVDEVEPEAAMLDTDVDQEGIVFDLEVTDPSDTLDAVTVELRDEDNALLAELTGDDGIIQGEGLTQGVQFYNLDPDTTYEVVVLFTYTFEGETYENEAVLTHTFTTEEG